MSEYTPTIGLEIHAELQTNSKMFCGCKNDTDEKNPNVNICPICMGHPGTLPVINREAVRKVLQVGIAVTGTLADFSEFDRKNYFYPDIPKGYQISQYKFPLVSGGNLSDIEITRIHLEEDTARSSHDNNGYSLVDFNRAGVPLMELVTEPVMHSAAEVVYFGRELQLLLQYLGVSNANMEKGEMRVEVNISLSDSFPKNDQKDQKLGTKVEIKNINSFRAAGRAIEYEIKRQSELLRKGHMVLQETRGFDENKGDTFSQRSKEDSHDYRYFPEPDLPKLLLSEIPEFSHRMIEKDLPETPEQKRKRFAAYGLKIEDVESYINDENISQFFEEAAKELGGEEIKILSNYVTSDLAGILKSTDTDAQNILERVTPSSMKDLVRMITTGEVSSRGAKDILKIMAEKGGEPKIIAEKEGLIQRNDPEEVKRLVERLIHEHADKVEEYKKGKESILQFFVGLGMKATKGSGNPELIKNTFLELIGSFQGHSK